MANAREQEQGPSWDEEKGAHCCIVMLTVDLFELAQIVGRDTPPQA
jgi:hypothetical protein